MRIRIFPTNYKIAIIRTSAVIVLLIIIRLFFIQWFRAFGMSMEPTVHDGSIVLVNKIAYKFHQIRRGDIVIFRTSNKPYVYFIKGCLLFLEKRLNSKMGFFYKWCWGTRTIFEGARKLEYWTIHCKRKPFFCVRG